MKKLITIGCCLIAFLCLNSYSAKAQNNGRANRAIALAKQECGNLYKGQNVTWTSTNTILGLCSNPGGIFEVYEVRVVFSCPKPVQTLCLPAPPITIATVTYNCEGEIVVDCH